MKHLTAHCTVSGWLVVCLLLAFACPAQAQCPPYPNKWTRYMPVLTSPKAWYSMRGPACTTQFAFTLALGHRTRAYSWILKTATVFKPSFLAKRGLSHIYLRQNVPKLDWTGWLPTGCHHLMGTTSCSKMVSIPSN